VLCLPDPLGSNSVATWLNLEHPTLSLRLNRANPNHHLWNNNGLWWVHLTLHLPDFTKRRVRRSLLTADLSAARRRRDRLLKRGNFSDFLDTQESPRPQTRT
jgi:hypothetical protein